MPGVTSVGESSNTYYASVSAILHSTLEAVQASYGVVSLTSAQNGKLRSCASYGLLPKQRPGMSAARWVVTHGAPLALENREQALLVPDLIISKSETLPLICVPIQAQGTTLGALQSNFLSPAGHEELRRKQPFLKLAADLMDYVIENTTVRKYAQSLKLEVELRRAPERLVIRVKDWGIGFIPGKEEPPSLNRSMGLLSMRRCAEFLGATFKINSSLGKGTEIIVDIPWLPRRSKYGENTATNCR